MRSKEIRKVGMRVVLMVLMGMLSACQTPPAPIVKARPAVTLWRPYQVGIGSWYRDHRTASGERFSSFKYTAAHRTLPFGTMVRVTNLRNGREVVVRINDRGPFIRGRVIDVSHAAGKVIGLTESGLAKVRLDLAR